jgi:hypothetical protein
MKRLRVKIVGLGLALATGSALAADDWHAPGQPAPASPGAPQMLPAPLRPKPDTDPIWLPVREPAAPAPGVVPAGGSGQPIPIVTLPGQRPLSQPQPEPPGDVPQIPRNDANTALPAPPTRANPLPAIPVPEFPVRDNTSIPAPPAPANPPQAIPVPEVPVRADPPKPAPPVEAPKDLPKPAEAPVAPAPRQPDPARPTGAEPPQMVPPRAPDFLPEWGLPQPRPVEGPSASPAAPAAPFELQPAPPELMYPAGAQILNKHSTFGSQPIRLSKDYPSLRDLISHGGAGANDDVFARRGYVRGEYLQWWLPGFPTPVLATTNANTALNGYFGQPGTAAIIGPGALVNSTRSGFRFRAGMWFDDEHSCGVDAGFFFLGGRSATLTRNSATDPLITRPVFVPNTPAGSTTPLGENGEAVAVPGVLQGAVTATGYSQLWGADVNLRRCLFTDCNTRAEWFVGYRHLNLHESLSITENITVIGRSDNNVRLSDPIGTRVVVQDRFATANYFNGAQLGALYERRYGPWDFEARGSFGMGATHQELTITGFQARQRPDAALMTFRGGLLAAGPNLGEFTRDRFSVVPEITLNVGYWVAPSLRVYVGYNFLYWTNVIRPGDQIDRVVDLTFVPNAPAVTFSGQNRPHPLFTQRDLVVNGVQFGLDWRW